MSINRLPKAIPPVFHENFANVDLGDFIYWFDNAIDKQGYNIEYQYHMYCPCISLNTVGGYTIEGGTGTPNPVCPTCKGTGRLYVDSTITRALVFNISQIIKEYSESGKVEMGTVSITPKSEIKLHYFDRFRLIDEEMVVSELFSNNPEHTYILQQNPITIKTVYMYVPNLADPKNSQVWELIFNTDFTVDIENSKLIITMQNPPPKYNISVLYLGNPWFYIINLTHFARGRRTRLKKKNEQWISLPRSGLAKRGDLIKI